MKCRSKPKDRYDYVLSLSEKAGTPLVTEERLMGPDDNHTVASRGPGNQPPSENDDWPVTLRWFVEELTTMRGLDHRVGRS